MTIQSLLEEHKPYQYAQSLRSIAEELQWSLSDRKDQEFPLKSNYIRDLINEAERELVKIKVLNGLPT